MTDHRSRIVQRVVHALEDTRDPDALVNAYFDAERDVMIEATRQTLEATREDVSDDRIAETLDRELMEALRYPARPDPGVLARLYVNRGRVAVGAVSLALALAAMAALVLL